MDSAQFEAALETLLENRLVALFGERYLALAVRSPMPKLPWKNQDGYPGGWFVYPRPAVASPAFSRFHDNLRSAPKGMERQPV